MLTNRQRNNGVTLVDLVACFTVIGILCCMLLTHLQREREAARQAACSNNLRNIGVAIASYHQAFEQLPRHGTGTHHEASPNPDPGDAGINGVGGPGGGNNGKTLSFDEPRCGDQFIDIERPRFWNGPDADAESRPKLTTNDDENRGLRWADAHTVFSGFNTILSPNSSLQVEGNSVTGSAVAPTSSRHPGGAHCLMADGSTKFYIDSIESGNAWSGSVRYGMQGELAPGSESPYGLWGALGTRAARDGQLN